MVQERKKERNSFLISKKKKSSYSFFSRRTPREESNLEVAMRHGYQLYTNKNRKSGRTYLHKNQSGRTIRSKLPPRPNATFANPPRFSTFTKLAPEKPPRGRVHPRPRARSICHQLTLNKRKIVDQFKKYEEEYKKRGCNILKPRKQPNIPNERLSLTNGPIGEIP